MTIRQQHCCCSSYLYCCCVCYCCIIVVAVAVVVVLAVVICCSHRCHLKATNYYLKVVNPLLPHSDPWNLFDGYILGFYFYGILPLRIHTWTSSESPSNNQNLEVAGYLYAVNTMLLTFRVFGSLLETFERVGTIQIALFQVINDALVVAVHFVVITVAFSSAITKVFRASPGIQQDTKKYS